MGMCLIVALRFARCDREAGRLQQSQFFRARHRLRSIARFQFAEDVADVILGGAFGDEQFLGDFFVAQSSGDEAQHFDFTIR